MSSIELLETAIRHLIFTDPKPELQTKSSDTTGPTPYAFVPQSAIQSLPEQFHVQEGNDVEGRTIISRAEVIKAINIASLLDMNALFQTLNPHHNEWARPLFDVFYRIKFEELNQVAEYAKDYVNKYLLQYVLSIVYRHRPDLKKLNLNVPGHVTVAPHLYFDMGDLNITAANKDKVIYLGKKFEFDHDSMDLEERLQYFRCDPGLNSHHRHWHEAYLDALGYQDPSILRDRAGELFYYMHSQMMARYNFERISVNVPLTEALSNLREPLAEPYFNKLTTETRAKLWDSRPPNQKLTDINVNGLSIKIQDLELWRSRIYEAIDRGYVYARNEDGTEVSKALNDRNDKTKMDTGIDILGNMVWAFAARSVNYRYYGDLHNYGHFIIGYSHDPLGLYYKQSEGSAMTMQETACRDAAFYRWHTFIDDIFERYKATLPEYTMEELEFKGIRITAFNTISRGVKNLLKTKWVRDRVNITQGILQSIKTQLKAEKVYYDFVHLDHDEFKYELRVYNDNPKPVKGTVRIFYAPIYTDPALKEQLYRSGKKEDQSNPHLEPSFNKLRRMFIELDKFVVTLNPGESSIIHDSSNSSVTVPLRQLFMTVDEAIEFTKDTEKAREALSWCGCGWPEYLSIGRGTVEGQLCYLFAMISDFEKDRVDNNTVKCLGADKCNKGSLSYCGVRDQMYPDRKPMGYPFDRNVQSEALLLKDFITKTRDTRETNPEPIQNMFKTEILVQHSPAEPGDGPTIKNKT